MSVKDRYLLGKIWFFFGMRQRKTFFPSTAVVYLFGGGHISWHDLFLAGNQGNHKNLVPSMLTYKLELIFMGM